MNRSQKSVPVLALMVAFAAFVIVPNTLNVMQDSRILRRRSFMKTLNELAEKISFESIQDDYRFVAFTDELRAKSKPPYLIIYDSSNLDIVYNHICNLQFFPNSLDRLVAVSLDQNAHENLKENFPSIPSVVVDLEPLKKLINKTENAGYLTYTLVLIVHTRIMASLAARGISFWSMHQDTIWVRNFDILNIEDQYPDAHMIFDRIGNDNLPMYKRINEWICAATFFIRASPVTFQFLRQTESYMLIHQSPESTVMTYLCGHGKYRCERMPRSIASSINYFKKPSEIPPFLIQMDASKKKGQSKMDLLRMNNFIFRTDNGTCDEEVFKRLENSVKTALPEERVKEDSNVAETMYQRIHFQVKSMFNVDPYNAKHFLKCHYHVL